MPGGERDDGLSPVCHPTPCPPAVPPAANKKDQRHFSDKKEKMVGEGGSCDGAFVSKCGIFAIDAPSVDDK